MLEIKDDFLDPVNYNIISNTLLSAEFPWYFNNGIVDNGLEHNRDFQFTHRFYENVVISNYYNMLEPILSALDFKALIRVKANLTTMTPDHYYTGMHTDYPYDCKTAVYYINTNDGWTEFENGTKIESVANRLVVFDTSTEHTGVTCCDESVRCLINFNYF